MKLATQRRKTNWERVEDIIATVNGEFDASDIARIARYQNIDLSLRQVKLAVTALRHMGLLAPTENRNHYRYNLLPSLTKPPTIDMATYPPVKNYQPSVLH